MLSKVRTILYVSLGLLLVLGIVACQGAAPPAEPEEAAPEEAAPEEAAPEEEAEEEAAPEEPITLRYQTFTAEVMEVENDLIAEYEANNPGIDIEIEPCPPMECYDKVVLSHEAGNPPDVFMGWWTFDVASVGLALDLSPYIEEAGGDAFRDKYVPAAFGMGVKEGSVYSLPWRTGASVAYVNLNLLEKAGLDLPEEGWTWADLREYATAMTDPGAGEYGFALSGASTDTGVEWEYWSFLFQNGGQYQTEDYRAAFNSPEGVEALEFLVDMIDEGVVHPGIAEMDVNQVLDLLAADKVGIWVEGPWYINDLSFKYPDANVTLAYGPEQVHDGAALGGTSLIISADTEHPQEAFDFISWMTSAEQVGRWAEGAAFLPAAIGAADADPAFQTDEMQVALGAMVMPNTQTANLYPENNYVNSILRGYLVAAYLGEMEPQEALDQAAVEWNEVMEKYYP